MSGIVAAVSKTGGVRMDTLRRATACLRHRGPDARHVWVAEDGCAGLGHARLRIIDLESGDQPIANEDGRIRIVVSGELHDFERIRQVLERSGHAFRTRADSEIALHLYEDAGTRSVHALRGEFALAIWDERARLLFAARDRFGIKPLYYTTHDATVYLASEVKAFEELGVPLVWDRECLYDSLFVAHSPERSLFQGIYQVPPGCWLLTDGAHIRIAPYWDWDFPRTDEQPGREEPREWVERLKGALEEAIRLRLRADVPVACYLSGAIDSCAVLGIAAQHFSRPMRAFALSLDQADLRFAKAQAAHSGADLWVVDVQAQEIADHFAAAVYHAERPFVSPRAVATYLLSRTAHNAGIKVVLTSDGSDDVFASFPHFRRDHGLPSNDASYSAKTARLLAEVNAATLASMDVLLPQVSTALDSVQRELGFVPSHLETSARFASDLLALVDEGFASSFADRDPYRLLLSYLDVERQLFGRPAVNQAQYIWSKTTLANDTLSSLGDRLQMAHSVEGRLPFLDHYLVRETTMMPMRLKICGTTDKYVLREAARPVLADSVYARLRKPVTPAPATIRPASPFYAFVQDVLRSDALDSPGMFNRAKVEALLEALPSMDSAARARADAVLTWMTSLCVLGDQMGL